MITKCQAFIYDFFFMSFFYIDFFLCRCDSSHIILWNITYYFTLPSKWCNDDNKSCCMNFSPFIAKKSRCNIFNLTMLIYNLWFFQCQQFFPIEWTCLINNKFNKENWCYIIQLCIKKLVMLFCGIKKDLVYM